MNTQKQIFLIVVLFFAFVGGCSAYAVFDIPHRAQDQADFLQQESVERGALLFANNCRTCHGISGEGIIGPQLNTAGFKDQDPLVLAQTQAMLDHTIACGRAGTQMPAWLNTNGGALSQEQVNHLVAFLTDPVDPSIKDANGDPESKGWELALEFGENLNRVATVQVSGDTLATIAKAHHIGYAELSAANNNIPIDQILPQNSTLHIPGFSLRPDGYTYHVYNNNETIRKITDSQFVGAAMLADLNKIPYSFVSAKDQGVTFDILNDKGQTVPGLFPGTVLKLTDGAQYVIVAEDTIDSIARANGVDAQDIIDLNPSLAGVDPTAALSAQAYLKLPKGVQYTVQSGDTANTIATNHDMKDPDALLQANTLTAESKIVPGSKLTIPGDNPQYAIQMGDTIASVAAMHNMSADDLAKLNDLQPTDPIAPEVDLKMPPIDNYVVTGQSLTDIAKGFSGSASDIAADFAKTNGIPVNAIMRVGQTLQVPLDSAGTAPPGTLNDGSACVKYAVPDNIYQSIPGVSTPSATVTPPATESKTVQIDAHADDWTVIADGQTQEINKGAVSVAAGTAIEFVNKEGLHTITLNGEKDGDNFKQGESRTLTFSTPGQFKITCDFHPAMLADVFVN